MIQGLQSGGRVFMPKRQRCPCCHCLFVPNPRVKERQHICGRRDCRREQKQQLDERWRSQNRDYFRGRYPQQKQAYGTRADYRRRYRKDHPDYVRRNAAYVKKHKARRRKGETEGVSSTSCDLRLTLWSQKSNVSITQVSSTSRDIFVTVCQNGA
jgi:hypothetical protein